MQKFSDYNIWQYTFGTLVWYWEASAYTGFHCLRVISPGKYPIDKNYNIKLFIKIEFYVFFVVTGIVYIFYVPIVYFYITCLSYHLRPWNLYITCLSYHLRSWNPL